MTRIITIEQFLSEGEPTEAERRLIEACKAGVTCSLSDTRPTEPTDANTVRAELIRFLILCGTPDCGLHESGVILAGAWITGQLDLQFAKGRGRLALDRCNFAESPNLEQAQLNALSLQDSKLPGLWAQCIQVVGEIFLRRTDVTGTLQMAGAKIGGQLVCDYAVLNGAGGTALSAQGMLIGDGLFFVGAKARGRLHVAGAHIGGHFECNGAEFNGAGEIALDTQNAVIGGGLFLDYTQVSGGVCASGAQIGGQLSCEGAVLEGAGGFALNGQNLRVTAGFFFREVVRVSGDVSLSSAHVGGLVDDLDSWDRIEGKLYLDGFTYDAIVGAPLDVPGRLRWLRAGTWFSPQPYTQLAKTLAAMGHNHAARRVLYEREVVLGQEQRLADYKRVDGRYLFPLENPWADAKYLARWGADRLARWIVGYGQKPWLALVWLIGLWLVAVWGADRAWREGDFAPNSDVMLVSPGWQAKLDEANPADAWSSKGEAGQDWESFNRYAWGLDLVVPILDIGQTSAWQPSKDRGAAGYRLWWARWWLQAFGWLVSALGLAAITGIMQRDTD